MQTNAQIRIYSAGIYLFKASNINCSRTRCEICSKLTKTSKRPHWHEKAMSKYIGNIWRFSFHEHNFFVGNKIVLEISSVGITDASSVHCLNQLSNILYFARFENKSYNLKSRQVGFALSIIKLK